MTNLWAWTKTWQIVVSPEEYRRTFEDIIREVQQTGVSTRDIFGVRLSLEEALTESIREHKMGEPCESVCRGAEDRLQIEIAGRVYYEK